MFEVKHTLEEMEHQTTGVYVDYNKPIKFSMEFEDLIQEQINIFDYIIKKDTSFESDTSIVKDFDESINRMKHSFEVFFLKSFNNFLSTKDPVKHVNYFLEKFEEKYCNHEYFNMLYSRITFFLSQSHSEITEKAYLSKTSFVYSIKHYNINKEYLIQGVKDFFTKSFDNPTVYKDSNIESIKYLINTSFAVFNEFNNGKRGKKSPDFQSITDENETLDILAAYSKYNPINLFTHYRFGSFEEIKELELTKIFTYCYNENHWHISDIMFNNALGFARGSFVDETALNTLVNVLVETANSQANDAERKRVLEEIELILNLDEDDIYDAKNTNKTLFNNSANDLGFFLISSNNLDFYKSKVQSELREIALLEKFIEQDNNKRTNKTSLSKRKV